MPNTGQPIENAVPISGKRKPKKLKVRHLSQLTRQQIVDRFAFNLDHDETATAMGIPGLTGRVVAAVLDAHHMESRKPPAREVSIMGQRRIA